MALWTTVHTSVLFSYQIYCFQLLALKVAKRVHSQVYLLFIDAQL